MTNYEHGRRVLIINPNTSVDMTSALKPLVIGLGFQTNYDFFTAPSGVASINNEDDARVSAEACLPILTPTSKVHSYDAFLVCCYSAHPLVAQLRREISTLNHTGKTPVVTGIFEASVASCLQHLSPSETFGIISTGQQWEAILGKAVTDLLGTASSTRYAGTETTGLNASELHSASAQDVAVRMKDATKRLLARNAKALCLGCAGMAGMDRTVRDACVEFLGSEEGGKILIVDGVLSGTIFLEGSIRLQS